jgi:hypothetical protein
MVSSNLCIEFKKKNSLIFNFTRKHIKTKSVFLLYSFMTSPIKNCIAFAHISIIIIIFRKYSVTYVEWKYVFWKSNSFRLRRCDIFWQNLTSSLYKALDKSSVSFWVFVQIQTFFKEFPKHLDFSQRRKSSKFALEI